MLSINKSTNIIQSVFNGSHLSIVEKASIESFIKKGHIYHLYTYNEIDNLPKGIIVKNGLEIAPYSMNFLYTLLNKKGGIWVDLDVICVKKFDFEEKYIFASENDVILSCVIKCPANNYFINYCSMKTSPNLNDLSKFELNKYVKKSEVFCPIKKKDITNFLNNKSNKKYIIKEDIYAVCLYYKTWKEIEYNESHLINKINSLIGK